MDSTVRSLSSGVMVLVVLLMIVGVMVIGLRRSPAAAGVTLYPAAVRRRWGADELQSWFGVSSILSGLTLTLALLALAQFAGGTDASGTSIGLSVGVIYALFVIARIKTGGSGRVVQLLRGVLEGVVGLCAIVPGSIRYFEGASGCGVNETPLWYSVTVYVLLLVATGWAVLRGTLRAIALRRSAASTLSTLLAIFAALGIANFFMSPFGLQIFELPALGWVGAFLGVLLLLLGCLTNPRLVTAAGGLVIALSTVYVDASVGEACSVRSFGDVGALVTYAAGFGITWLFVKVVFLDALLRVPCPRRR